MLIGAAIATQVQATATTRTKVLTARFMAFSLHAGPLGAETLSGWNYISPVKVGCQLSFSALGIEEVQTRWFWALEKARSTMCSNIGISDSESA